MKGFSRGLVLLKEWRILGLLKEYMMGMLTVEKVKKRGLDVDQARRMMQAEMNGVCL